MAQLQQLTQLMISPTPALTIAPPQAPTLSPPVSSSPLVLDALSKQWARPKLPSLPDFSGKRSSSRAFFNFCTLYLYLAPEQFSYDKEKILWTLTFFKERRATRWSENLFHQEAVMEIKRFDHETKVKAKSERQNLQTASQLCTKQVGTGEINQIIESLLKVKVQRITKTYQIET